jgi:hypothetical protein
MMHTPTSRKHTPYLRSRLIVCHHEEALLTTKLRINIVKSSKIVSKSAKNGKKTATV